jgi:hypothetical protein
MHNYKLYQSEHVLKNQQHFIDQCVQVKESFPFEDTTNSYYKYNIFSLTAGSVYFYALYKELKDFIRTQLPTQQLWMQSWVNMHTQENVLDWHDHSWDYHGYISIDPKNTTTEFKRYTITNNVGQIYFGPGGNMHKVNVVTPYTGDRITIGYDVSTSPVMHTGCLGLFPLI